MKPQRIAPKPGQESVWDYPRPPIIEDVSQHVRVVFNGEVIADTRNAKRVLETSHPPSYYIPFEDLNTAYLTETSHKTFCEFKGRASYWNVQVRDQESVNAGWSYANPTQGFEEIKDYVTFYPSRVDACFVGDERVRAQEGDFYGGWITSNIVGPFKGGVGSRGW